MKVAVLFSLARQVEGEYVFVNVLKAHVDPNSLRGYIAESQLPRTGRFGDVDCVIEYGVITDVEVDGIEGVAASLNTSTITDEQGEK